jgi:hypothetical protein
MKILPSDNCKINYKKQKRLNLETLRNVLWVHKAQCYSSYETVTFTTTNSLLLHIFVFLSGLLGQTSRKYSIKLSK